MSNREIKFRAWDKVDHDWYKRKNPPARMVYFANPTIYDDGWLQFESVGQDPIGDHGENRFELMQYTGLKDKNGKEVYEGDIIQSFSHKWSAIVRWSEMELSWMVEYIDRHMPAAVGLVVYTNDAEVIGNIYENPELLKGTE